MSFYYPKVRVVLLVATLVAMVFSPLWLRVADAENPPANPTETVAPPATTPPATTPPATANPFTDISRASPYFIPVSYLKNNDLIKGYEDGSFQPERSVSRAEALAMILKAAGIEANLDANTGENIDAENPLQISLGRATDIIITNVATGKETLLKKIRNFRIDAKDGTAVLTILRGEEDRPFRDVSETDWFYNMVREAKLAGFVSGYEGGKYFRPNADINLAEILRILFQVTGTVTKGNDSPLAAGINPNAWYADDIKYATFRGMLMQRPGGEIFPPHEKLNRGQMALLIYRFLQSKNGVLFGYASWYADGLSKTTITTGLEYKEQNLTAAHKKLPFGTVVRVTNMNNGKQTNAVINDRGPFVTGRIIDLSRSAFAALEATSAGVISVQVEVITPVTANPET